MTVKNIVATGLVFIDYSIFALIPDKKSDKREMLSKFKKCKTCGETFTPYVA